MKENLLKCWSIYRLGSGKVIVEGRIYNDSKNRFEDGKFIHTSAIKSVNFEDGTVVTQNSVYNLDLTPTNSDFSSLDYFLIDFFKNNCLQEEKDRLQEKISLLNKQKEDLYEKYCKLIKERLNQ